MGDKKNTSSDEGSKKMDFIREIIAEDIKQGKHDGKVHTRFPPEPNGFLHIGHCKAISINYDIAEDFGGKFNLRFDDTNPSKESTEYVEAIKKDIQWLGCDWEDRLFFASDYFDKLYDFAVQLIKDGKAFVCDLTPDEVREYRGTATESGKNSPNRDRSVEENLDLFERMKNGEFEDGAKTLRAKIDMSHPNFNMRDPVLYRIMKVHHHRTGDKWCIYPMYDYTHPISDSLEGITHSLCSLEFEHHRPLYNWCLDSLDIFRSRQIEFSRLNLDYTVTSKRKLLKLVEDGIVNGWDDPRMPTISGMRRRGFTAKALRNFCRQIGVTKREQVINLSLLEHFIREDLNDWTHRVMGVIDPIKVTITNYPEDKVEEIELPIHPGKKEMGNRKAPFSREIYIDRSDFMEDPPKKFFRLSPGGEVRLRYAHFIKCEKVIKDDSGEVIELECTYDAESVGGKTADGRKVKGIIHWVSARHSVPAEVRVYNHLFTTAGPDSEDNWMDHINPDSLEIKSDAQIECNVEGAKVGDTYQFERMGYFCVDPDTTEEKLVFNRTITLKDTWAKIQKKQKQQNQKKNKKKQKQKGGKERQQ